MNKKWKMHRFGLIDFWYYVNEEFYFSDGHMLLRGSNGSGKSVTLQSCIPLLLDGNRSSERIDPFGTRARKVDTYLIDEDSDREERIGYLYLEFKKSDSELYTTIGMGLRARKNKPLESWYFVIEDNMRVNKDLQLIKHGLALTKKELRNIIGNQLIEQQKQYMEKVNKVLFGFETTEEYKEAIDLLLQVRRPKLSNDFKPTMLNEVLNQSLQPLSEEDLRPMSEAITNMDSIKDQLDTLKINIQAANVIEKEYDLHSYYNVFRKLELYEQEQKQLKSLQNELEFKGKEIQRIQQEREYLDARQIDLDNERSILEEERRSLASDDIQAKQDTLQDANHKHGDLVIALANKEKKINALDSDLWDQRKREKQKQDEMDAKYAQLQIYIQELDGLHESFVFGEHESMKESVFPKLERQYDLNHERTQLQNLITKTREGLQHFKNLSIYQMQKNNIQEAYELDKEVYTIQEKLLVQQQQNYQNVVEDYKANIVSWNYENHLLKLSDEQKQQMMKALLAYEDQQDYHTIRDCLDTLYKKQEKEFLHKQLFLDNKSKEIHQQKSQMEREMEVWQNKQDIQPELHQEALENRKLLRKMKIPFVPFYSVLEFDPNMQDSQRNYWEEVIDATGLLHATIVEEKYREQILSMDEAYADVYVFTERTLESIDSYEIKANTTLAQIMDTLQIVEKSKVIVHEQTIQLGYLEKRISQRNQSKYIGSKAREAYRKKMLMQMQEQLDAITLLMEENQKEWQTLQDDKQQLENEYHGFPSETRLYDSYKAVHNVEIALENLQSQMDIKNKNLQEIHAKMQPIVLEINKIAKLVDIEENEVVFQEKLEVMKDYETVFTRFSDLQNKYYSDFEILQTRKEMLESTQLQLDEIQGDVIRIKQDITKVEGQISILEEQLQDLGIADIQQRLETIGNRLFSIGKERDNNQLTIGDHNRNILNLNDAKNEIVEQIKQQEVKVVQYQDVLIEELQIGYFEHPINSFQELKAYKTEDHEKRMLLGKNTAKMQDIFHNNKAPLAEYHLSNTPLQIMDGVEGVPTRFVIDAKFAGKQVNFFKLVEILKETIEEHEKLLLDSDRQLFEDILIHTISSKVKYKINQSRRWVEQMNVYMDAMNTSSNLKLQLVWKAKKADDDEQMHVNELIKLLEIDAAIIKPSDLTKISRHFRSKINQARTIANSTESFSSFHQIMKEVMDYRSWFEFTIIYEKDLVKDKELTNNKFATFSGGEKAISMYIPLFSAVAAKFSSGKADAPSMIALDEAFAGVDDNNIESMFELIEKFNFDYIMNSQILWGDYPSVKSLNIYELHRPEGGKFVSIFRYHWNGQEKSYIAGDVA
ncbi:uncharacterized protein (TIGR02680 family) [Breznakia blatticola]|uniref:Uncharacterized protein (TIGR02680 family) n=1 Tax=Breznakia blatticola TaxID=1754012 RepID=A0A4V3G6T2_9FIRM|nr:TIGR02680 family protein [Breznakia blatticola]TDW16534.1 uncharacterized protein (TIGR02680 family) [Breznakia blatticola]